MTLKPDVITMDVNMPVLDGISTVRKIMECRPTPILMLSAMTIEGAQETFNALEAGALDFLPKIQNVEVNHPADNIIDIIAKINAIAKCKVKLAKFPFSRYEVLLIGASTGGTMALQSIIRELPANFPVPIVIVQHMPENFTKAFAERLNSLSNLEVKEAAHNDLILPGNVYIAPGGKQLFFKRNIDNKIIIEIKESDANLYYRPCIDISFTSASRVFNGKVLAVILTGMGADGKEGIRELKKHKFIVWVQDEKTCIVYGMPQAVYEAGLADKVLAIEDFTKNLISEIG